MRKVVLIVSRFLMHLRDKAERRVISPLPTHIGTQTRYTLNRTGGAANSGACTAIVAHVNRCGGRRQIAERLKY